nr:DUF4174 domain-containing protein [Rhodohalobacter sp. SW132]
MSSSTTDPIDLNLSEYRWENRVILLFATDSADEHYHRQAELLKSETAGMADRDLMVVSVFTEGESHLDGRRITDRSADRLRNRYWDESDTFTFILLGKDGGVKIRAVEIVEIDQLFGRIDSMPMRQREIRNNGK